MATFFFEKRLRVIANTSKDYKVFDLFEPVEYLHKGDAEVKHEKK